MVRRLIVVALLALALPPAAAGAAPSRLSVELERSGRGGTSTAIAFRLHVDTSGLTAPVTTISILTPQGLELTTSDLGIATCRMPAALFAAVIVRGPDPTCPANAVLGTGEGVADVRFSDIEVYPVNGSVTLYMGPSQHDRPGLAAYVIASRPIRTRVVYGGYLFTARPPYGVGLHIEVTPIPDPPLGVEVALRDLRLVIGAPNLRYQRRRGGRTVLYHPEGIPTPASCPRRGFPFVAQLHFADGSAKTVRARATCP